MRYEDAISYLYGLQKFGIKLGLRNIERLCEVLSYPYRSYGSIHIGGTNGKGSTAAMLFEILKRSGYRVGMYTSPHLVSFRERIIVDNEPITEDEVCERTLYIMDMAKKAGVSERITFFEFVTAMAYHHFKEKEVDLAIFEVGMGGRLDATNVISPICSIITHVEMEHAIYLGDTIEKIAYEKAGIIKRGIPLFTAEKKKNILKYFEKTCKDKNSTLFSLGKDFFFEIHSDSFDYFGFNETLRGIKPSLFGSHQFENASLATSVALYLKKTGYRIENKTIKDGIANAKWQGRFEKVYLPPLLILDGAHNPSAMKALKRALDDNGIEKTKLIFGVMNDKDYKAMLSIILPIVEFAYFAPPNQQRSVDPAILSDIASQFGIGSKTFSSVKDALKEALVFASADDIILVTGSLFTVGEVKECLGRFSIY